MSSDYSGGFSRFFTADPQRLHLAAHSHHPWPDVTREAQLAAWDDAARLADHKWDRVFDTIIPTFQRHVAQRLNLCEPDRIAVAPNTHDLVRRILSCLPLGRPSRILTTDGEFHSLSRQLARLEEDRLVMVERVATEPFADFPERFAAAVEAGGHDLVFVSQVFFNSGYAIADLARLVETVPDRETLIVIDGYHGFMAVPTDLAAIEGRAFYIAGGYKYAMAGEGACFMHCPPGYGPRPRDTGWFAAFGALTARSGEVGYGSDGSRFLGATFDVSGLYRFNAVMDWLDAEGITVEAIHQHVEAIEFAFIKALGAAGIAALDKAALLGGPGSGPWGHFLTFRTPQAGALHDRLLAEGIVTDHRGDRLRFGFGLYHRVEAVPDHVARIAAALH